MRNSLYSVSFDDAIETIGGKHKYQKFLLVFMAVVWATQAFFVVTLKFLLKKPILECDLNDCCKGDYTISEDSLDNISKEFELVCGSDYKIELIMMYYYSGVGSGMFLLSWLANM